MVTFLVCYTCSLQYYPNLPKSIVSDISSYPCRFLITIFQRLVNIEVPSYPFQIPVCRARSSTITTHGDLVRPKDRRLKLPLSPATNSPIRQQEDAVSLCPSVNSRKDSGIRSTSRRSSIQQQVRKKF